MSSHTESATSSDRNWASCLTELKGFCKGSQLVRERVRVSFGAWIFGLCYVALSEARTWGFSVGVPVSSPPSSVNGLRQ